MQSQTELDQLYYTRKYIQNELYRKMCSFVYKWFDFLYTVAHKNAVKDTKLYKQTNKKQGTPTGILKTLWFFQERCRQMAHYDAEHKKKVVDMLKNTDEVLKLVRALTYTNAKLAGAYIIDHYDVPRITDIPTKVQFIFEVLVAASRTYFSDPQAALGLDKTNFDFNVVDDALGKAIHKLVPLEQVVIDICESNTFQEIYGKKAARRAETTIEKVHNLDNESLIAGTDADDDDNKEQRMHVQSPRPSIRQPRRRVRKRSRSYSPPPPQRVRKRSRSPLPPVSNDDERTPLLQQPLLVRQESGMPGPALPPPPPPPATLLPTLPEPRVGTGAPSLSTADTHLDLGFDDDEAD